MTDDILPIYELSKFLQINTEYLILLVFIFGFITISIAERNRRVRIRENKPLDDIFLISFSGLIWVIRFRFLWIITYNPIIHVNQILSDTETTLWFIGVESLFLFSFFVGLVADVMLIFVMRRTNFFEKMRNRIERDKEFLLLLLLIVISMFLSVSNFTPEAVFWIVMVLSVASPLVFVFITLYHKMVY
jgi:hypothetical protein